MLLVFSFTVLAIVSVFRCCVACLFVYIVCDCLYFTLFCVFNAMLLIFDILKFSDDVVFAFSFIHALLLWFSSAFSLSAHVSVFRCWFKHHCVSYLQ